MITQIMETKMKCKLVTLMIIVAALMGCDNGSSVQSPSSNGTTTVSDSSESIDYQIKVQRATQAAIWGMPAVGMNGFVAALRDDLGGDLGDVVFFSTPMNSRHGFLTANDVSAYVISSFTNADGPMVVDVPAATDKANFFGTFVDGWDTPIADVGVAGADEGKGGKFLFLPPGYEGEIPDGYLVFRPNTNMVHIGFRPVVGVNGTYEDTIEYGQTLAIYPLTEAANPEPTHFIDAYEHDWDTLPKYDMRYFESLNYVIQYEPVIERDKAMMALLAGIGIEKGKPFNPDAETKRALEEGLKLAYASMQSFFTTPGQAMRPYWTDADASQWLVWDFAEGQPQAGFPYVDDNRVLVDERAGGSYFWITFLPKNLGGNTFYLTGLRDSDQQLFSGESTYRLRVPADTPAKDFWSVIVYSMETKGFMKDIDRVGLSDTNDKETMQYNDDGSVDLYLAPTAPEGLESNWIPTGDDFFLLFRLYGPDTPLFEKTWKLGDVEKVN